VTEVKLERARNGDLVLSVARPLSKRDAMKIVKALRLIHQVTR
jgi:hypothetical protein